MKVCENIWINADEVATENGKLVIEKGSFFFNNSKYIIDGRKIMQEVDIKDLDNIQM